MHRIGAISALRLAATRLQISNGAVIALTKPRWRHACWLEPGIAVNRIASNNLARHAREGSSAGSTFARLLGCKR